MLLGLIVLTMLAVAAAAVLFREGRAESWVCYLTQGEDGTVADASSRWDKLARALTPRFQVEDAVKQRQACTGIIIDVQSDMHPLSLNIHLLYCNSTIALTCFLV
jgi:hypothetical protein